MNYKRIISAVKRVKFVSVRISHIIFLNVHAPTEDKTDDVKDSFYEELERVFVFVLVNNITLLLNLLYIQK
jgi:hypothetical protein